MHTCTRAHVQADRVTQEAADGANLKAESKNSPAAVLPGPKEAPRPARRRSQHQPLPVGQEGRDLTDQDTGGAR